MFVGHDPAAQVVDGSFDALGVEPDGELAERVPAPVRAAVSYGRPIASS